MANTIIGIADMALAEAPDTLTTLGLGSCVGIVLYDRARRIGGLSHILLPKAPADGGLIQKAKYADTAIDELIGRLAKNGAAPHMLTAKLAGGASMFFANNGSDIMQVGRRNVEMCREVLKKRSISILAEDTGGNVGRTIVFDCGTGELLIRTAWPKTEKIL
ncbi:MAG TPA: chemotaxis protein CheD [Feifaniaceae bacterium]|nr:chemotaxis protein CheD [Feifaniaceae bacterium]